MAMAKDHSNVEPDIPEMSNSKIDTNPAYHRYHIETAMTPDTVSYTHLTLPTNREV